MIYAGLLWISKSLSPTERLRVADMLSTIACELVKGEYHGGPMEIEIVEDQRDDPQLSDRAVSV